MPSLPHPRASAVVASLFVAAFGLGAAAFPAPPAAPAASAPTSHVLTPPLRSVGSVFPKR